MATLSGADLCGATLAIITRRGECKVADLRSADLRNADLREARLSGAELGRADLREADLRGADLRGADRGGAELQDAILNCDFSQTRGLESVDHSGPSEISMNAVRDWNHSLPDEFLRGIGLSPAEVVQARMLNPRLNAKEFSDLSYKAFELRTKGPIFLGGAFISYSHHDHIDSPFVGKLHDRLEKEGANVWLDERDLTAGPLKEQITRAIAGNHCIIAVLSERSIESDWVVYELNKARTIELEAKGEYRLCPVALDDAWKRKDGPLWDYLRHTYHVVDFSKWKTKVFADKFKKLLTGMKIYYPPKDKAEGQGEEHW